jgi:hypothetical protein
VLRQPSTADHPPARAVASESQPALTPGVHAGRVVLDERRLLALQLRAGNRAVTRLVRADGRTLARSHQPTTAPRGSPEVEALAQQAIDQLTGSRSSKILLATVLSAAKRGELPVFAALLKAHPHDDYTDCFVALAHEFAEHLGSMQAVSILEIFADAGVDVAKDVPTVDLQPLGAVAGFKSFIKQVRRLIDADELSREDATELQALISEAAAALRDVEHERRPAGPRVKLMGGVAMAAGGLWRVAGALAADDVTGIGVADDVAIPFVVVAAAILSAIVVFGSGSKVRQVDYRPVVEKVGAALRKMTDLVAISKALAVQGPRAAGQLSNVAVHLARLLALAAVGGQSSGEPPKKNNDNDKHWWTEIKASLKNFFQAAKGASRKQLLRELLKYYTEEQIAEIEAALARAEELMGEQIGKELIPRP